MERRAAARGQCQPVAHSSRRRLDRLRTGHRVRRRRHGLCDQGQIPAKAGSRENQISGVFLSLPRDDKPRTIRAVYQDGTRLSGDLEKVGERIARDDKLPGISRAAQAAAGWLAARLVAMRHPDDAPLAKSDLTGRLELDGLRLPGRWWMAAHEAGASCLVWQPLGSDTASALKPGVSGRIIYREPPPPAPPRVPAQNQGM